MATKFAIFTDLHYDNVFDAYERFETVVDKINQTEAEFVINLGDFCKPVESNKKVLALLDKLNSPCYHAIGNHDSDEYPKEQVLDFLGLEKSHYSFVKKGIKFIVLDGCYIKENDAYTPFNKRNYAKTDGIYPILPDDQMTWLEDEISDPHLQYVILSHHSLENDFKKRGIHNRLDVQTMFKNRNVLMCINGHDHSDELCKIDETHYFTVNALSYIWLGGLVTKKPYETSLYDQYPILGDIVLYESGVFANVTIHDSGAFEIEGMSGAYKTVTPQEMGVEGLWNGKPITPHITSTRVG